VVVPATIALTKFPNDKSMVLLPLPDPKALCVVPYRVRVLSLPIIVEPEISIVIFNFL
jgi:hypothetical protein